MSESNSFARFAARWLPPLEDEMRDVLAVADRTVAQHYQMMHYHMGWVDADFRPGTFDAGKRIRPLLCLMACEAVGGRTERAVPAAAAVEILHNFSLVHDDIEDVDEVRRHRPTLWKIWGPAQAINAGDGMFALAFAALLRCRRRDVEDAVVLAALERFTRCCAALTEGQHLDLGFERRAVVQVDEYVRMITGKTASLLATSLALGAQMGGASAQIEAALYDFGLHLGLAFQVQDDILGIWGDPESTGKAAGNDILRRKKSLPLVFALQSATVGKRLAQILAQPAKESQLPEVLSLLETADAQAFAEREMQDHHRAGLDALTAALGPGALGSPLGLLAEELLGRQF